MLNNVSLLYPLYFLLVNMKNTVLKNRIFYRFEKLLVLATEKFDYRNSNEKLKIIVNGKPLAQIFI